MINKFHPSKIVDALYDATDKFLIGLDRYDADIKDMIPIWFKEHYADLDVKFNIYDAPEDGSGICFVAWNENGNTQLESFEYWY